MTACRKVLFTEEPCGTPEKPALTLDGRLLAIDAHINNLKRCLLWLTETGVPIISVNLCRGRARPEITVAGGPRLRILLGRDCANVKRRCDGMLTFYGWVALRYECLLKWEEVNA